MNQAQMLGRTAGRLPPERAFVKVANTLGIPVQVIRDVFIKRSLTEEDIARMTADVTARMGSPVPPATVPVKASPSAEKAMPGDRKKSPEAPPLPPAIEQTVKRKAPEVQMPQATLGEKMREKWVGLRRGLGPGGRRIAKGVGLGAGGAAALYGLYKMLQSKPEPEQTKAAGDEVLPRPPLLPDAGAAPSWREALGKLHPGNWGKTGKRLGALGLGAAGLHALSGGKIWDYINPFNYLPPPPNELDNIGMSPGEMTQWQRHMARQQAATMKFQGLMQSMRQAYNPQMG